MDHIELPSSWVSLPKVPLLCGEWLEHPTNTMAFSDYPASQNVDIRQLKNTESDQRGRGPDITGAFLQDWLFFYFLKKTIGVTVDIDWSDFHILDPESGRRFITTGTLHQRYLTRWRDSLRRDGGSGTEIRRCLELASSYTTNLLDEAGEPKPGLFLPGDEHQVILSFMVLHSTVYQAFLCCIMDADFHIYKVRDNDVKTVIPGVLKRRLLDRGFCRYDIANLAAAEDLLTILYLSCIPRSQRVLEGNHAACDSKFCWVMQIDESRYSTKHNPDSCSCSHVPTRLADVKSLLLRGGIPVVKIPDITGSQNAELQLRVDDAIGNKPTPYVAISHVWADGLGDTMGNSLPRCQMERLRDMLRKFHPIVNDPLKVYRPILIDDAPSDYIGENCPHMWIDTLCIPRPPASSTDIDREDAEKYRKLAIMRMNDTYTLAGAVLALDSELQEIPYDCPIEEIMPRLLACGWMKRLWTYLEAALSIQRLYVQLKGGALHVWQAFGELLHPQSSLTLRELVAFKVVRDLKGLMMHQASYQFPKATQEIRRRVFEKYLNDTRRRAATRPGDRYICFAIILGLSREHIRQMNQAPIDRRWHVLIQYLPSLPRSIIFSPGPKFLEDGYRWMRSDFSQAVFDHALLDDGDRRSDPTRRAIMAALGPNGRGLKVRASFGVFPPQQEMFSCLRNGGCWVFPVVGSYDPFVSGWWKMTGDTQTTVSMESINDVFIGSENWWMTRPFVVLLTETIGVDPILGALVSMEREMVVRDDEEITISGLLPGETMEDEYDSDASGYFVEVTTEADRCRYVSRVTLEPVHEVEAMSLRQLSTCLVTQVERDFFIL